MRDPLQFVVTGQLGHVFTCEGCYVTTVILLEHQVPEHRRRADPDKIRDRGRRSTARWYEQMMADPVRAAEHRAKKRKARKEREHEESKRGTES